MKYFYKDFATGKIRWTSGKFIGWTAPTGLLKTKYAEFRRKADSLFIPDYSLTTETKAAMEVKP